MNQLFLEQKAKHWIRTGYNISPKTSFGDYNVLPNADLVLQAGETIDLKPGTHIMSGAKVHLYIEPLCQLAGKSMLGNTNSDTDENNYSQNEFISAKNTQSAFQIYPNPNNGKFQLQVNLTDFAEGTLELYSLQGIKVGTLTVRKNAIIELDAKIMLNSMLIAKLFTATNYIGETKIIIR